MLIWVLCTVWFFFPSIQKLQLSQQCSNCLVRFLVIFTWMFHSGFLCIWDERSFRSSRTDMCTATWRRWLSGYSKKRKMTTRKHWREKKYHGFSTTTHRLNLSRKTESFSVSTFLHANTFLRWFGETHITDFPEWKILHLISSQAEETWVVEKIVSFLHLQNKIILNYERRWITLRRCTKESYIQNCIESYTAHM